MLLRKTLAPVAALLVLVLAVTAQSPARAETTIICTKPGVPLCMSDTTTFVSADKMAACQFEVKEYVDKTMDYLRCLNEENTSTGQELTRNVERFNCRLSGRNCG
ncbi:hypothetical protein FBZ83_108200 [Azospirillum brasilense]|uniref:DUF1311 domain-containing protein n=1 Tax=Azospirillum brasilense TaxID=192 RepID=A0A560C8X4_AZOBR|nr:hypothetical protein [Azospirillum brasilense]TWA81310.1 hypothetical protein FBZ83_108200 [Azospirillum brasilense]